MNAFQTATDLRALGLNVLPARYKTKSPVVKWTKYQDVKPAESALRQWFSEDLPSNFWVMSGHTSGVLILDIDNDAALRFWSRLIPDLKSGTHVTTGGGGWHFYFAHRPDSETWSHNGALPEPLRERHPDIGPGEVVKFDVRANGGGGVIAHGSTHENGNPYTWGIAPEPGPNGEPPAWRACPDVLATKHAAGMRDAPRSSGGTRSGGKGGGPRVPRSFANPNWGGSGKILFQGLSKPSSDPGRGNVWFIEQICGPLANIAQRFEYGYEWYIRESSAIDDDSDNPQEEDARRKSQDSIWEDELANQGFYLERDVRADVRKRTVSERARKEIEKQRALAAFREPAEPVSLADELSKPYEPLSFAVEGFQVAGTNATLTAQFKTGKTTLAIELMRSLVDGVPFLGKYATNLEDGRNVAFLNCEMDARQFVDWCRRAGIQNVGRVIPFHLRGFSIPLNTAYGRDWLAEHLRKRDVGYLIGDTFARMLAMSGGAENDNDSVLTVTEALDALKVDAGISGMLITAHTGRATHEEGEERARGATRFDDWADSRWLLTRNKDGDRFIRAHGRDVEVPEQKLGFDPAKARLTVAGGSRQEERKKDSGDHLVFLIAEFLRANPGAGVNDIKKGVKGNDGDIGSQLGRLICEKKVIAFKGPNRSRLHFLPGTPEAEKAAQDPQLELFDSEDFK